MRNKGIIITFFLRNIEETIFAILTDQFLMLSYSGYAKLQCGPPLIGSMPFGEEG